MGLSNRVAVCGLVSALIATPPFSYASDRAQAQIAALAAKIEKREIGRIEIMQIPLGIVTRIPVTPEKLEQSFRSKLVVRDVTLSKREKEWIATIKSTSAVDVPLPSEPADIRVGIVFYDTEDRRVASLFFDRTGERGAIGGSPASFSSELFDWVMREFSCCFR